MRWTNLLLMLAVANFVSACPGAQTDSALWKDVAKRPPDAQPGTVDAISQDPPFAAWVLYMDRACDEFGCPQ